MTLEQIWALPPEEVDKVIKQLDEKPELSFQSVSDGNPFDRFLVDEGMEKVILSNLDQIKE